MKDRKFFTEVEGKNVPATALRTHAALTVEAERKKLQADLELIQSRLAEIQKDCQHEVFWDTAGHPCDVRHCVECGHQSLI